MEEQRVVASYKAYYSNALVLQGRCNIAYNRSAKFMQLLLYRWQVSLPEQF